MVVYCEPFLKMFQKGMFFLLLFPALVNAQPRITEGKLFYDISYKGLSNELKNKEHLLPHDASLYFKNEKCRIEMGAGQFGKNTTIVDKKKGETIALLNIYGKKFAIRKSDSEMVEVRNSLKTDTAISDVKIEIIEEYKTIAGYKCQKAIIKKTSRGLSKQSDCWFTKEIPPYNTQNDEAFKLIDGFLMQFNIQEEQLSMTMTVKMVHPIPMDDKLFEIPNDYQLVTEKELTRVLKVLQQSQSGD